MYQIKAGSKIIYDSRNLNDYPVIKPVLSEELNSAGTLEFVLLPGHPYYEDMQKMHTIVTAYRDGEEIFYGRILAFDKSIDRQLEISCEGGLTFFLDSEMSESDTTETVDAFITRCIEAHNSQVEEAKRFAIGTIQIPEKYASLTYPFKLTGYNQTKNVLETMVLNQFGGYFRIRPNPNGYHFIDYIQSYGRVNPQPISLGLNIEDKSDRVSGENIFTILRPLAKESGKSSDVTIESLDQSDITLPNVEKDGLLLRLTDKIEAYGNIIRTESFDNVEKPLELLQKAEEYIARNGTQLPATVDITFVDFYFLNPATVSKVLLGDEYTNIDGFSDKKMIVSNITSDMADPANDTITFKNEEELYGSSSGSFGSMTSSLARSYAREAFRYKYITETVDDIEGILNLHAPRIEMNTNILSALTNQTLMVVQDQQDKPGEYKLQAVRVQEDPLHPGEYAPTVQVNVNGVKLSDGGEFTDESGNTFTTSAQLKVQADRITAEVSRASEAEDDLSAALSIQAGELAMKVSSGDIASAINMTPQEVLIQASKINLDGYVTVDSLSATNARITNLMSGVAVADVLSATGLIGTRLSVDGEYAEWHRANWDIPGSLGTTSFLGYQDISIGHYHVMSESNGVITLGAPTTNASSATFNIADTQFYKDAVQSAYDEGAASTFVFLKAGETSFDAQLATLEDGGDMTVLDSQTVQLALYPASDYDANTVVRATSNYAVKASISTAPVYNAGQNAVTVSGAWSGATYTATTSTNKTASTTITGVSLNGVAKRGSGAADLTQGVIVKAGSTNVLSTNITVDGTLRYNDGWTAARGQVALPGAGTGTSFTVNVPSETVGNQDTATFTIANSSSTPSASGYANVSYGGNVVGRVNIGGWYSSGVTAGQNAVTVSGAWSGATYTATTSTNKTASTTITGVSLNGVAKRGSGAADLTQGVIVKAGSTNVLSTNITVDGTLRYNDGVAYGKETYGRVTSVTGWSDSYPFQPSDWTQLDVYVKAATDAGDDYAWTGKLRVDASGAYGAGYDSGVYAGKNAVNVVKGTWSNGLINFTTSAGSGSGASVYLRQGVTSWGTGDDANTATVYINDLASGSAVSTNSTVTVDASARYQAGYDAGLDQYYSAGNRYWGYSTNGGATWNFYYSGALYRIR